MEIQAVLWIFSLEFEISGVAVQKIHQNLEKRLLFNEDFPREDDMEAVLATLLL